MTIAIILTLAVIALAGWWAAWDLSTKLIDTRTERDKARAAAKKSAAASLTHAVAAEEAEAATERLREMTAGWMCALADDLNEADNLPRAKPPTADQSILAKPWRGTFDPGNDGQGVLVADKPRARKAASK